MVQLLVRLLKLAHIQLEFSSLLLDAPAIVTLSSELLTLFPLLNNSTELQV